MKSTGKEVAGVKLYTMEEVAKMLDISRLTVFRYIKAGRIKAQRIGRPLMITDENLRQFLYGEIADRTQTKPEAEVKA